VSDPAARLEALRRRFVARCEEDLAVLERALAEPGAVEPGQLRFTAHRLSGAAGTFGYADLSRVAGEVDDVLVDGRMPGRDQLEALVAEVRAVTAERRL